VSGRDHELLQSLAWSRVWLAVLGDLPAPADNELERARLGWLMGGFPWADHHHDAGDVERGAGRRRLRPSGSNRWKTLGK